MVEAKNMKAVTERSKMAGFVASEMMMEGILSGDIICFTLVLLKKKKNEKTPTEKINWKNWRETNIWYISKASFLFLYS